ncbi:flavin reductase family protein [Limnobacter litoralis]|uniref:Flavin reductase like domain-containing protein n=1 Tax=Limnobacter litoralis TaxID=481366 RepID=A0ABQ5YU04_9BURK|nr:flavin reductase family protein [Limnobacter litoralis]GLR27522.1 hypothetical protein GCM10007875_26130 [Limnobacter litoralis]
MFFDTTQIAPRQNYQLLTGGVLPRPIAWVSTLGKNGVANLAPYSFFTVASCNPPVLCVVQVTPANQLNKDTLTNLKDTSECVVNVVSQPLLDAMNISCATFPPEVDEFEKAGLEKSKSHTVAAPGVKAALVRYECKLRELQTISGLPTGGTLMLLDVTGIEVADHAIAEGQIDPAVLQAVGKMGGDLYSTTDQRLELPRPRV